MRRVLRDVAAGDLEYDEKGLWEILLAHPARHRVLAMVRAIYPTRSLVDFAQWHLPAIALRELVGRREWERLFTFAFVRNPWDAVVSAYHFDLRELRLPHLDAVDPEFARAMRYCTTFDRFVRLYPIVEPFDMTSMIADERGEPIVNFVGRFENAAEDFRAICERLGLPGAELPWENRTDHGQYRDYYTAETRELVGRYFARDIARFGYRF